MKLFEKYKVRVYSLSAFESEYCFRNNYRVLGRDVISWNFSNPKIPIFKVLFPNSLKINLSRLYTRTRSYHPDMVWFHIKYAGTYNPLRVVLSWFANRKLNRWVKTLPECYTPCPPFYRTCNCAGHKPECTACMEKNGLVDYIE
jgi:hypothetical protein